MLEGVVIRPNVLQVDVHVDEAGPALRGLAVQRRGALLVREGLHAGECEKRGLPTHLESPVLSCSRHLLHELNDYIAGEVVLAVETCTLAEKNVCVVNDVEGRGGLQQEPGAVHIYPRAAIQRRR